MKKRRLKGIVSVLLFMVMPLACAEAALYIDDTSTTGKGHFSLEFSADYYKDVEKEFDPDSEEYTKTVSKEVSLTPCLYYGLTDNWEAGVTMPYTFLDDSSSGKVNGFGDLVVGSKYRFWEETDILPSFALAFDLKTDSANDDKGLGTGKKDYTLSSIFTKTAGDYVFDLNLGYVFVGGAADDIFLYSVDAGYDLNEKLSLCAEIYGETNFAGSFDDNIFCTALSLGYEMNEMVCIESGVGIGISKASPDYQLSTTLTFEF
jgi:hypothetical protein